jgi:hypothetical protein
VLYFYLQPEDATSEELGSGQIRPPDLKQILETTDQEWVPRTPKKPRHQYKDLPGVPSLSFNSPRHQTRSDGTPLKASTNENPFSLTPSRTPTSTGLGHKRAHSATTSASPSKRRPLALPLGSSTNFSSFDSSSDSHQLSFQKSLLTSPRKLAHTPRRHHLASSLLAPNAGDTPNKMSRSTSDDSPLGLSARSAAILSPLSLARTRLANQSLNSSLSSLASSDRDREPEAVNGIRSVSQKRELLGKHLGDVEGLVNIWDRRQS